MDDALTVILSKVVNKNNKVNITKQKADIDMHGAH